jgi:hypothetical protein
VPDDEDDGVDQAPRYGGRRRGLLWALLVATVVVAAGVVAAWGLTRPGKGAADSFERLLETSATAHQLVGAAVSGACSPAAPGLGSRRVDLVKLEQAVTMRQTVLSDLARQGDVARRLPHGPLLFSELTSVSQASLQADRDYEYWLRDLEATGCYSGPTNNLDYRAAAAAATEAIAATRRLEGTWAEVAPGLHMPVGLASEA